MAAARIGVVAIVLEGLRPDMVTADVMPNLTWFEQRATAFTNARSVFPCVTPVTAASLATARMPGQHGIPGNEVFLPDVARDRVLDLADHRVLRGLDQSLSGRLLSGETFADRVAACGGEVAIVDAGAAASSFLLNPRAAVHGHWTFSTLGRDATATPQAWDETVRRFGHPPERELPRFEEVTYAANVFIDLVIAEKVPDVALLWLSEPDATAHFREIGSIETENTLRHADRQIGRILDAIEQRQGLEGTLVLILSDHGQITAQGEIDVCAQLALAQFAAGDRAHVNGAALVFTGGGYGALTTTGAGDDATPARAARWLMEQSWVGHVFTAGGNGVEGSVPGTFALSLAGLEGARAAEVVFTFASNGGLDRNGMSGRGLHNSGVATPGGIHGGLNAREMSTLLLAAGPGFEPGLASPVCAGLVDVAPTVLAALGLTAPEDSIGRNLAGLAPVASQSIRIETETGRFSQAVHVTQSCGRRLEMDGRTPSL